MVEPSYNRPARPPHRQRRSRYSLEYMLPTIILLAAVLLIAVVVVLLIVGISGSDDQPTVQSSVYSEETTEEAPTETTERELTQEEKKQIILSDPAAYSEQMRKMVEDFPQTIDFVYYLPWLDGTGSDPDLSSLVGAEEMPLLLQFDERWGYLPYGSGHIGYTGCGPTCLSMVAIHLTGDAKYTPVWMCDFATKEGYYSPGAGTAWTLFSQGAAKLGLVAKELPLVKGLITDELDKGNPVVLVVGPGDFTKNGHYIILTGYDSTGFTVNDPFSVENSSRTWTYAQLEPQILNLWSFRKAES